MSRARLKILMSLVVVMSCGSSALAVRLGSITRIKGTEGQEIVGVGLVTGLKQTGDGGKFLPAMRKLAGLLRGLGEDIEVDSSLLRDVKTVAIVTVSATVRAGAEVGDRIDVRVTCIGSATSLKGGRLYTTPMTFPVKFPGQQPRVAFASGNITLPSEEDLTNGIVEEGAALLVPNPPSYVRDGKIRLVLNDDYATLGIAKNIADTINDEEVEDGPPIARHLSSKTIEIEVPKREVRSVTSFLARVLEIDIDRSLLRTEARVVINRKTGSIVMTEDVEINPVLLTHKGLTITKVTPEPPPTPEQPRLRVQEAIGVDPNQRSRAKLADLVDAFNQFQLPVNDRIEILKKMKAAGQLFANLIIEE